MRRYLVLEHIMSVESDIIHSMEEPVQDFDSEEAAKTWINKQLIPESFSIEDQLEDLNEDIYPEHDDFYALDQGPNSYYSYEDIEDYDSDEEGSLHDDDMGE